MVALFRHHLPIAEANSEQGFSCILSVLDPSTSSHEALNQIDPSLVELFTHLHSGLWRGNLDPATVGAFTQEIKTYGPFRPVRLERTKAAFAAKPLSIRWNVVSLSHSDAQFHLSFVEPGSGRRCSLDLRPLQPRILIEEAQSPPADAMTYATYPRLEITGAVEGEEVKGVGWMDHQWGDGGGWLITQPKDGKLLGWDWLGINLDEGTDILVMVHREMQNMQPAGQFAMIRRRDADPALCQNFTLKPLRHWESKRTRIRYPVSWQLEIPEFDLSVTFSPLLDDQEINVFGLIRAIWEGAGTVSGTVGGEPVSGRARLELYGYGFIFDFNNQMDHLAKRVNACIEDFFPKTMTEAHIAQYVGAPHWKHEPAAYEEVLARPIWDLMSRRGKYWRPIFGILLLEALGVRHEPYEMLTSCILELNHTGSLIIDDIEDDSKTRRGDQCIHRRYGLDIAINAGNTLYFLPYLLLAHHEHLTDYQRMELYRIMVQQLTRSHFGQSLDLYWSRNLTEANLDLWIGDSIGPKILQMYAYKTASASEGMAQIACVTAQADSTTRQACAEFGKIFGVAFQIVDDVHNFADSPKWTKDCGEDIRAGKLTYVIFRALELSNEADRRRLKSILCSQRLRKDRGALREGIELVRRSGALDACRREAVSMFEAEWDRLSQVVPPSEAKVMLRMLCANLLHITCEA